MSSTRRDKPSSYETQTDDPEILAVLAGIDDVLKGFAGTVKRVTRDEMARQLRAMAWRALMEPDGPDGTE